MLTDLIDRESLSSTRLGPKIQQQSWLNLRNSQHKQVESNHTGAINCIDLDQIERRYLLSAGKDQKLSLYDVAETINSQPKGFHAEAMTPDQWGAGHTASISCVAWYPIDTGIFLRYL